MSNIDFEVQDGNPAAVAVRFHVAHHGVLTHMDFHLGSAMAALDLRVQASSRNRAPQERGAFANVSSIFKIRVVLLFAQNASFR